MLLADLVMQATQRPFLGKRKDSGAALVCPGEVADVLDDAGILVVSLFDRETVIGDARGGGGLTLKGSEK
jgi:hypothetical protein